MLGEVLSQTFQLLKKKKKIHWIIVYGHCKGIIYLSSQNRVASMDGLLVITSPLTPHVLLDSQNFSIMCVFCIHLICQKSCQLLVVMVIIRSYSF